MPLECLKSNVTELRSHESPGGPAREIGELDTGVGKTHRNASAKLFWASFFLVPSALLIPTVIRTIVIT